ncbi:MAG: BTAD domain-containing putative transcriptional regulator [Actinomycetota bacterium]
MADHLVFRVLGPLEVERNGSPIPFRGSKLKGLLAVLLFGAEQVFSSPTLIDALWGDEPPATARTALQMHVSRLRKLIDGDPTVILESRDRGYVLHVGPDRLDLDEFRRLAQQGRAEMAHAEYRAAWDTLDRALKLWKGTPLSNVDIPGVPQPELAELDELLLATRAERLEAQLALGRHVEAVPELEALRAALPLNERIHGLAAIALYRTGRQAEALDSITQLRHRLSTEVGIEVGPAIRRLERQILAQDAALNSPALADETDPRTLRKTVAALVCRFSTGAGPTDDPEAGKATLDRAVQDARGVIESYGGWVYEVVVGRISAVFGVPRVHEDDVARAVRTAMELRATSSRGGGADAINGVALAARMGIGLGEALVESSAAEQRLLTLGPIEEADQLAQAARPGEVLMSGAAARLVERAAGMEPTEILILGEESSSLGAFRLVDDMSVRTAGRRFSSPLVGRQEELTVLRQAFARASLGRRASLVTLLGSAGVGKTRLVSEFLVQARESATVLTGHCLSYGRDITFWPVAEMVRQAARIDDADLAHAARTRVGTLLGSAEDAGFVEEQIASILGLSENPPAPGETLFAIRRLFEIIARDHPLVLVFDDIHWAETTLLDLIEHVARASRGVTILVVCMTRAEIVERRPGWGGGRLDAVNLPLLPLDREESTMLVNNLVGPVEIDDTARERILEAGEGHPLFLEELVAMLIDDGLLQWTDGRWVASSDLTEVPIPPTIHALIGARLDRLGGAQRRVLENASVVGQIFTTQNLAAFDLDHTHLETLLDDLDAKDLISVRSESPSGGRTFRFRHHLIRDVVYRAMSKEARAAAHEALGGYLEAGSGSRIAELEEIVGYHFETAHGFRVELGIRDSGTQSLADRAGTRLWSAGVRALARDDNPAASSLLNRALGLLDKDNPLRVEIGWRLGVALFETGDLDGAESVLGEALTDARRLGNEIAEWRIRLEQTDIRFWRAPDDTNTQETERIAADAEKALRSLGELAGAARAHRLLGDALGRRGRAIEAVEAYEIGQRLAREAGDEREAAQRSSLGVAHGPIPVDRCIQIIEKNLASAQRPDPEALAGLGFLLAMAGRFDQARKLLDDAVIRAGKLGTEWRLVSIRMHYGAAMLFAEDPGRAEVVLRPAVEALKRMGERSMLSTAVALLAEALYRQGNLSEAMRATIESEHATAEDDVASQMAWRGVRSKVLAANGELMEAERLAGEGVAFAAGSDLLSMAGDAHLDLGIVLQAAGKVFHASAEFQAAADLYRRKGNAASLARVEMAEASLGLGAER